MSSFDTPLWTLEVNVFGPFQISARFALDEVDVFFAEGASIQSIEIKNAPQGAQVFFQVRADSALVASQIALMLTEQIVQILTVRCNIPMIATRQEGRPFARDRGLVKRSIEKGEWQSAFRELHYYRNREPGFLRVLYAYHRAINEELVLHRCSFFGAALRALLELEGLCFSEEVTHDAERLAKLLHDLWGERTSWPYAREEGDLQALVRLALEPDSSLHLAEAIGQTLERIEVLHRLTHACIVEWRNQHMELPNELYHIQIHVDSGWGHLLQ